MNKSLEELLKEYELYKNKGLPINIARGKPNKEQLDLSNGLFKVLDENTDFIDETGNDVRNYGELTGTKECKHLFSDIMSVNEQNIIVCGNSSLNIEFELISASMSHGVKGITPWNKLEKVKWLCPVPGYDRHFAICEYFGIEMINIPMTIDGPNMDMVEEYIKDPLVKGIWCIPVYSNPTGITYSNEVVERFAKLKPAAKDFRIYWDLAYVIHHLYNGHNDEITNLLDEAKKYGNEDMIYMLASTSKITFAGAGVAALAASNNNIKEIADNMKYQIISYDKVNQLRHALYFKEHSLEEHMKKHAEIIRPKFESFLKALEEIEDIAWFTKPNGGYFISLFVKEGTAGKVIQRCKECGLTLTDTGCAYPYHKDPSDSHIRIAPTYLEVDEIEVAAKILTLSVRIEYLLNK